MEYLELLEAETKRDFRAHFLNNAPIFFIEMGLNPFLSLPENLISNSDLRPHVQLTSNLL